DLDDGIDSERRIQLRELKRKGKQKNKGPNVYYFDLGQQFATKKIVTRRVRKQGVGPIEKFKEVEVDVDNESEEKSDTKENDNSSSDSEDLDYDSKHDEVFDDDEHIAEDVHVQEHDLDVIDYNSVGSDLDDGIDSERRI
nr:hypothetical protein [Tanacetum cinerariifolium]